MDQQARRLDSERIYTKIESYALAHTVAQDKPGAILLGGQPGSGKSELARMARHELSQSGGAVVIDADKLRERNPTYIALSKIDPQHAADRTHKEAAEWARRLTTAAVQGRRNLVIDGTMRDPEGIRHLATQLREHGYTVEARVIAVNPEVSIARARLRFEEQVASRGVGRFVNQAQHDVAYKGLADSVSLLESSRAVDAIRVYDANQREIFANRLEKGQWARAPGAGQALSEERTRAWTHAEHRHQVATLTDITYLARQREGYLDRVIYTLETMTQRNGRVFGNVYEAAEAFRDAKAESQPVLLRTERMPSDRDVTRQVAQTTFTDRDGQRLYRKAIVGEDEALKRAYAAVQRPDPARQGPIRIGDDAMLAERLARAQQALQQIEQSTTYQRAHAFDTLRSSEALGRYPELDGAYKQLQAARGGESGGLSPEKNETYLQARAELSAQLHRGEVPKGAVTREESRQVLEMAASQRRLVLRDGDALGRPVQGELVAGSSHHVLVRISDLVALSYERGKLDREVSVGDRLVIEPGQDRHRVHEQSQAFERDHGRDPGLGRER
ncbi:MAG: zeta toxin family protein [Lautropia sp.]|nr:zeta toxin family protein [Lautropia sp.]